MSSFLTKTKVAAGSVPNASTGKVNEFVDSADGYTKSKDESGNIEIYSGTGAVAVHVAQPDPHPQYVTPTEGAALFDPLGAAATVQGALTTHTSDLNNPHATTKAQVGLGNCDNTSDVNKPISTLQQAALNLKYDASNPNGYETPSQLNTRDTNNRARANHTGTQTASTISDFSSAVNTIINALKGVANGLVPLDGTTKISSIYLPSFVDDVLEFANLASFPVTGETGKMYIDLTTNKTYRWSGTVYVEISASPGSTDAVTEGASNLYFTPVRVLATVLSTFSVGLNAAISATDTIVQAFGKVQAQINNLLSVKADKTTTISTGTGLNGGGDLTANRTISHNNFGTAGTYGSANSVPVFTTETTGHISSVTSTLISILSTAVTDFASAVRAVVLTGLDLTDSTDVVATDTVLQAVGKLQAQNNLWFESVVTAQVNNTSNTTLAQLSELSFPVVNGKRYRIEAMLMYQSTATTTGLALSMANTSATGELALLASMSNGADGTGSIFTGHITAFNDVVTATGTAQANTSLVAKIEGVFVCTTNGTLTPVFRSEVNGNQVSIRAGSSILVREF